MTSLEELAAHLDEVAAELSRGNRFDLLWSQHLQTDAQQLRLLALGDRHRRGVDQPRLETEPEVVVQKFLGLPVESPPVAAPHDAMVTSTEGGFSR
jgi:hypothetical protein